MDLNEKTRAELIELIRLIGIVVECLASIKKDLARLKYNAKKMVERRRTEMENSR